MLENQRGSTPARVVAGDNFSIQLIWFWMFYNFPGNLPVKAHSTLTIKLEPKIICN